MTREDHEELVEILLSVQGKVMLSGYKNDVYARLEEAGWHRVDYHTACHAVGKTRATGIQGEGAAMKQQPRVESVWLNPQAQRKGTLL